MGPKGSSNKWKWEVSMAQLVLQSRPFLKCYVPCILREISWFQGSLKGYKIKRRINGRIICRNYGCSWDFSKYPVVTSTGIVLCIVCWNRIWRPSYHSRSNSYQFLPYWLITKSKLKWILPRKDKAAPLQAWTGPQGSKRLRPPDFLTSAQEGGRLSALRTGSFYPQNYPGAHFFRGWFDPRGHGTVRCHGKNAGDTGNQCRDLPTWRAVP